MGGGVVMGIMDTPAVPIEAGREKIQGYGFLGPAGGVRAEAPPPEPVEAGLLLLADALLRSEGR
jgi:hypothetical protein